MKPFLLLLTVAALGLGSCSTPTQASSEPAAAAKPTALPAAFTPQNSAILLVDHQDMTVGWIKSQPKENVLANVRLLARLGTEMHIPLVVTSTMEVQIGTNIKEVQQLAPAAYAQRVKRGGTLNCFLDPAFAAAVKATGRQKLIVAGLTTDICLMHTVKGALRAGYTVQVVADACGSMTPLADEVTFARLRGLGATVTDGNQMLSELYSDFGTPEGQRAQKINLEEVISKLPK
ncbi:isochorismatase family protein [Hymenobacter sp. BRD67]|uniref:isochorismatase family protein n=1 Tax=Hymenobacter sp. BRD67 TaxID=2675877 RepID=UPI001563B093|nr:isochorismatase family protein [Hymenobacter sp. BRD67]QKG54276.1 isochorismatase family protein [Hymenobacter sp. BRD67]